MADPVTIGLAAAGAGVAAFGASQKADATTAMYNYKAGVAQANAAYADANAQYAIEEGAVKEQQYGIAGAQTLGHIRVAQAASGLDVNTGTGRDVVKSEIAGIQQGENIITYDAAKKAYGFSIQAANFKDEAQFDTASGKNVQSEKWFDIGASLLGGASSVSGKWTKFAQAGVGSGSSGGGGTGLSLSGTGGIY
jgi:hypothetical protein